MNMTITPNSAALYLGVEKARALLAKARELEPVIELRDQAEAVSIYLRRKDAASSAHADAWEIVQLANRRLGELCREFPKDRPGPRTGATAIVGKVDAIQSRGLSRTQVYKWERLAALPESDFRARISLGRERITKGANSAAVASTTASPAYDADEWCSPPEYVHAGAAVMGGIDTDPASSALGQSIVNATTFYTKEQDGLTLPWSGRVWLHPPSSMPLAARFVERFCDYHQSGEVSAGIVLVTNSTDAKWFQRLLLQFPVCFPVGRPSREIGEPRLRWTEQRRGVALFYAGDTPSRFAATFARFGAVAGPLGGDSA